MCMDKYAAQTSVWFLLFTSGQAGWTPITADELLC
jgi:hypothetical protein